MPEKDPETGHSSRLLRGLIWAGVLLAPLAAAIVLLGDSSGSVRFAVLLIAVSVALIGASVLIRSDPVLHRMHVEDRVAEEIETLRRDLRAEFARGAATQPAGNSGFFRDAPMAAPDDDPFPATAPRRDPAFANGGRAVGDSGFPNGGGRAVGDSGFAGGGRAVSDSGFAGGGRAVSDSGFAGGGRAAGDSGFVSGGRAAGDSGFVSGGRAAVRPPTAASVPPPAAAAVAAVRPMPPGPSFDEPDPRYDRPGYDGPDYDGSGYDGSGYDGPGYDGPGYDEPGPVRREPGMTSGARPVAATASAGVPQPRGAASIPASPAAPRGAASVSVAAPRGAASVSVAAPRGAASVRPAGAAYGPAESLDSDFGASNGYAAVPPSNGYPASPGGSYGSARVTAPAYDEPAADHGYGHPSDGYPGVDDGYGPAGDGYRQADDYAPAGTGTGTYGSGNGNGNGSGPRNGNGRASMNGYGPENGAGRGPSTTYGLAPSYDAADNGFGTDNGYGPDGGDYEATGYGPDGGDYEATGYGPDGGDYEATGYGLDGGYDGQPANGDPAYKARRHRPSANDTNVGTLADFAAYPGWENEPQVDERYVQGYGRR